MVAVVVMMMTITTKDIMRPHFPSSWFIHYTFQAMLLNSIS
jgi:hypothetical protein